MEESIYLSLLDFGFLISALVFTGMFITTIAYGKELNKLITPERREFLLEEHSWHANGMLYGLFVAVLMIEIKVRLGGFADRPSGLLWKHLFFAIPFLFSLLLLRFKITGKKNLLLHKKIAQAAVFLFVGTVITGSFLFFNW